MSDFQTFLFFYPWIAAVWWGLADIAEFVERNFFQIVIVFILIGIRNNIRAFLVRSAPDRYAIPEQVDQILAVLEDMKKTVDKAAYSVQELADQAEPILREQKIEIDLRHGRINASQARILRGL